jgi:hypothetical protein
MDFHSSSRCIADRLKYDFIFDEIFGPNHFAAKKFDNSDQVLEFVLKKREQLTKQQILKAREE